ncbi:MAG: hypothetical protein WAN75_26070, partial [Xanthobacteraceae bacterium]
SLSIICLRIFSTRLIANLISPSVKLGICSSAQCRFSGDAFGSGWIGKAVDKSFDRFQPGFILDSEL